MKPTIPIIGKTIREWVKLEYFVINEIRSGITMPPIGIPILIKPKAVPDMLGYKRPVSVIKSGRSTDTENPDKYIDRYIKLPRLMKNKNKNIREPNIRKTIRVDKMLSFLLR